MLAGSLFWCSTIVNIEALKRAASMLSSFSTAAFHDEGVVNKLRKFDPANSNKPAPSLETRRIAENGLSRGEVRH